MPGRLKCPHCVASDPAGVLELLLPDGRHRRAHPPEEVSALSGPEGGGIVGRHLKRPSSYIINFIDRLRESRNQGVASVEIH